MERPGQLWHLDMTSVWVAEHGWVYLNAIIDCCTREIVGWELCLRCRAVEAIAVINTAVPEQGILPGTLTLGTDNGSAFTARATRLVISGLGVSHRRGGYRDPESQAFIESWFRYLKERCVWRHEFETLDQAQEVIAAYIDHYHDRPHSRLNYRTPPEVSQTWDDTTGHYKTSRPEPSNPSGSAPLPSSPDPTNRISPLDGSKPDTQTGFSSWIDMAIRFAHAHTLPLTDPGAGPCRCADRRLMRLLATCLRSRGLGR